MTTMQREIRKLRPDSPHALRAALYETLIQLARAYTGKTGTPVRENATAVRLRLLIEREFRERLTVEGKRQLLHTDATVAEIGYALGFKDPAYFARFFRRETGSAPTVFRERAR